MLGQPDINLTNVPRNLRNPMSNPEKISLAERAYKVLREQIIYAELKPGEILTESELAEYLGISKTPVRDALRALVQDGFITSMPRKGYVVRSIGLHDIKEVLQLRIILEPGIAAAAAEHITEDDLVNIRQLLDVQRKKTNINDLAVAARNFHLRIITAAQNDRAFAILLPLFDETTRMHHLIPQTTDFLESEEEISGHEEILKAFEDKNPAAAEKAMRDHIESVRTTMIRGLLGN